VGHVLGWVGGGGREGGREVGAGGRRLFSAAWSLQGITRSFHRTELCRRWYRLSQEAIAMVLQGCSAGLDHLEVDHQLSKGSWWPTSKWLLGTRRGPL